VTSGTLLVTGTTTVNASTITTTGATQHYQGNVTLNSDVNFTGTTVQFDGSVLGGSNRFTVTGNAILGDAAADSVTSGRLLVTGTTTVNAATVTATSNTQTYQGDVTLGSNVNFTGTTVEFDGSILGSTKTLTVTGDAIFGDAAADSVTSSTLL